MPARSTPSGTRIAWRRCRIAWPHRGFFVAGSGFRAVGIPDCVGDARTVAAQAVSFVRELARRPDHQVEGDIGRQWGIEDEGLLRNGAPGGNCRRGGARSLVVSVSAQQAPDLHKILADIRAKDNGQLAVSEEDGRFLRLLIASAQRKRALEIGGASGYSAIWMAQGLRETGGKLVTIEYDPVRARELAENIRKAGMTDVVQVVAGDAFAEIPKLPGTFDFVFLDAWKRDYKRFLELMLPRLDGAACSPRTTW